MIDLVTSCWVSCGTIEYRAEGELWYLAITSCWLTCEGLASDTRGGKRSRRKVTSFSWFLHATRLRGGALVEQGWRSGERTCLPPMWPKFDFWTQRHMWVEFVVGSPPCLKRFFSENFGFPFSKTHFQIPV